MTPLQVNLSLFEDVPSTEEWKVIEKFPNYAVSDLGRVKRLVSRTSGKAGTILKAPTRLRYPTVDLCNEEGRTSFLVHRIVASAFIPNIEGKPEVNHIDGNRSNPAAINLEWVSRKENCDHVYKTGLRDASGEGNGKAVLTWDKVFRIRVIAHDPKRPSYTKIGNMFGVNEATIRGIVYMQSWVPKNSPTKKIHKRRNNNKPMGFFAIAIRNSKNRGAVGHTTVALLEQKMAYYGWMCRYCGVPLNTSNRSLDHAIPLANGGTNWTSNFIPCCRTCNSRKRGKTIEEFLYFLGKRKAPMFAVDPAAQQDVSATIQ